MNQIFRRFVNLCADIQDGKMAAEMRPLNF